MNKQDDLLAKVLKHAANIPTPSYYMHGDYNSKDLVSVEYFTDSALCHIIRAGKKSGETKLDALLNAHVCLLRAIEKEASK